MKQLFHAHLRDALRFKYIFPSVPCILVLVTVFVHSGCNLFKTRTPAEPDQTSSDYVPPSDPSVVFSNMVNAFKDKNDVNYLKSFADITTTGIAFSFEATASAKSNYGIFQEWTKDSEQKYFNKVCNYLVPNTTSVLEWGLFSSHIFSGDSALYEATYSLMFSSTLQSQPVTATGRSQFYMRTDNRGYWVIYRWIDSPNPNVPNEFTWSDVKGTFAQ